MATVIDWADGVNTLIRRSGTSWNGINAVIEDTTLSGRAKRRFRGSYAKRTFSVKMIFTLDEYRLFNEWYQNKCRLGFYPFNFPTIDAVSGSGAKTSVYRFAAGSPPSYSNPSGNRIEVTMSWEEV